MFYRSNWIVHVMAHCFFFLKKMLSWKQALVGTTGRGVVIVRMKKNVSLMEIPYNLGQGPLGKLTRFYTLTFWPALHESFNA